MNAPNGKRQHHRSHLSVWVHWHNRSEEAVSAELRDVSTEGVFLVPLAELPPGLAPGDTVWIVVKTAEAEETLTGTVRWRGFHPTHGAIGCGILLDPTSFAVASRLQTP